MPDVATGITGAMTGISALSSMDSGGQAANTQSASADQAIALQNKMYEQNRKDLAPWRNVGSAAEQRLGVLLGLEPSSEDDYALGDKDPYTAAFREAETAAKNSLNQGGADSATPYKTIAQMLGFANAFQQDFGSTQAWLQQNFGTTNMDSLLKAYANKKTGLTKPGAIPGAAEKAKSDPEYGSLLKDFTISDFQKDPGYDFRMGEGTKALERSASARGGVLSGRALKETERYGQDYASNEYGKAFDRFDNNRKTKYNMLSGVAGGGQTAVNTGVNNATNTANNISDLYTQQGNVNAAGQVADDNSWSTGLDMIGSFAGKNSGKISDFFKFL